MRALNIESRSPSAEYFTFAVLNLKFEFRALSEFRSKFAQQKEGQGQRSDKKESKHGRAQQISLIQTSVHSRKRNYMRRLRSLATPGTSASVLGTRDRRPLLCSPRCHPGIHEVSDSDSELCPPPPVPKYVSDVTVCSPCRPPPVLSGLSLGGNARVLF